MAARTCRNAKPMRSPGHGTRRSLPVGAATRCCDASTETLGVALLKALGRCTAAGARPRPATDRNHEIDRNRRHGPATAIARDVIARFPDSRVVIFAGATTPRLPGCRGCGGGRARDREALDDAAVAAGGAARRADRPWSVDPARGPLPPPSRGRLDRRVRHRRQRRDFALDATVPHSAAAPSSTTTGSRRGRRDPSRRRDRCRGRARRRARPPPSRSSIFHVWPGGFRSGLREWPVESWRELIRRAHAAGFRSCSRAAPRTPGAPWR